MREWYCSRVVLHDGVVLHCRWHRGPPRPHKKLQITTTKHTQVDRDLRKMLLRPDAPPPRKVAVRVWPRAIPQFNVGHTDIVKGAQDDLEGRGWGGVILGGNYVAGG